jgi:Fe/S biogenesis protein NfuA
MDHEPTADTGGAVLAREGSMPEETTLKDKVQELLDTAINPAVAGHGGYIELIDVKESTVYIRMSGGCQGCGAADVTLKAGIERMIFEEIPEVTEVLDTTDHASGSNPYYAPSKA